MTNQPKILATVAGKPITELDVQDFIRSMGPRGAQYDSPEGRKAILEQLIGQKLFLLDAQKNLYEAEAAFKAELQRMKEQLLSGYAVEKALASVKVTDAEVEKFYEDNKDKLGGGETVSASHILVDSEEKANEIKARIESGEIEFGDAAREYSSCPSKAEGGSLGEFGHGQMVPEFDTACFEMQVGELRGPVKTQFGYHLIRLDAKNEAKTPALAEVRDRIYGKLMQDKQQAAYQSKINQLKILFPVDKF